MNHRELIEAANALNAASLLERRGARLTNNRTRFSPCPSCKSGSDKGRGCAVIHRSGKGYYCPRCETKGSSLDILLLIEGLDPKAAFTESTYEIIARELGEQVGSSVQGRPPEPPKPPLFTRAQIEGYYRAMRQGRGDAPVKHWLCEVRGLPWDRFYLPGVAILPRQIPSSRPDIRAAVEAGPCAVFPLYSTHPDNRGQLSNLVIRPISPTVIDPDEKRPWKSKCFNSGDGTTRDAGHPLVYGDPAPFPGYRRILVVEGALDQMTVETIVDTRNTLVIGAFCAGDIPLLASYLHNCAAPVTLVPHMDKPTKHHPGGAGQEAMAKLQSLVPNATPFNWPALLSRFGLTLETFAARGATDINDLIRTDNGPRIATFEQLQKAWHEVCP